MCDIDHEYTDNLVCPFCGHKDTESREISPGDENLGLTECTNCEKYFYGTRNITISYSTEKATYATCKGCGAEDVPVENLHSSIGKYEDLCLECGPKEKRRLEIAYIEDLTAAQEEKAHAVDRQERQA
jgi:transcription elongation factor Elf1